MMKKCFAILMSLILLSGSVSICFAATPDSADAEAERRNAAKECYQREEAVNADFADNHVLFMIYECYNINDFTLKTFQEFGAIEIEYIGHDVFFLVLDKHDKRNVLDVICQLYDMPEVYSAQPDFYYDPYDPTTPANSPETTAPAEEATEQTQPATAAVKPTTSNAANSATPDSAANDSAAAATAVSSANSDNGTVQTGGSAFSVIILSALITAVAFAYFSYMKKQN